MALQRLQVDPETMNKDKQDKEASDSESQGSTVQKKRRRDNNKDDDEDIILSPAILAKMSRSERKRHREKKRRSDVNKGFDDLMNLLLEIDPVVRAEAQDRARRGQWKGNLGAQEDNLLSRVELIGRTVDVLGRVHKENEERKQIIEQLLQQKTTTAKAPAPHSYPTSLNPLAHTTDSSNVDMYQHLAGFASLPHLRAEQLSHLSAAGVTPSFFQQQQQQLHQVPQSLDSSGYWHNGNKAFSNVDILTFAAANPHQMASFSHFPGAPGSQGGGRTQASLLNQLVTERDKAAAFARARSQLNGDGKHSNH